MNKAPKMAVRAAILFIAASAATQTGWSQGTATRKSTKADSVTINLPEGMTKEQADAILNELRQIRQLLEKQNAAVARPAAQSVPAAPPQKLSMAMDPNWYSMGRADAPLTLVEFTDYQCPFCRRFHAGGFAELKRSYIDTGKLRFISRDLPLDFHPYALKAAYAARCAGEQGRFWEMRDALISHSDDLATESLLQYAQTLPLEMNGFRKCLDANPHRAEVQKDIADAGSLAIDGTPTFVLGKVVKDRLQGERIVGAQPYSVFDSEIKKLLTEN